VIIDAGLLIVPEISSNIRGEGSRSFGLIFIEVLLFLGHAFSVIVIEVEPVRFVVVVIVIIIIVYNINALFVLFAIAIAVTALKIREISDSAIVTIFALVFVGVSFGNRLNFGSLAVFRVLLLGGYSSGSRFYRLNCFLESYTYL
jgi:hypothetical protein